MDELRRTIPEMAPDALKADLKRRMINRLHWLNMLRWFAVAAVAAAVAFNRLILQLQLQNAAISGSLILLAATNIVYIALSRRLEPETTPMRTINSLIFAEISTDFLLLAALIHFTGGVDNFFAFFFVVHIMIAVLLMPRGVVYGVATVGFALVTGVSVAELRGFLPHYDIGRFGTGGSYANPSYVLHYLAILAVLLYATAYVGLTLSTMLRRREMHLTQLKDKLEEWNRELMAAHRRLRTADREKTEFLRMSGHEMVAPLTAMLSIMRTILEGYVQDKGKILELLGRANQRGTEAMALATNLLELAREKGKSIEPEKFDLIETSAKELEQLRESAIDYSVELVFEHDGGPIPVNIDRDSFRLALRNLLSNAIKYSKPEGTVTLRVSRRADKTELIIADTGIGIPQSYMESIFQEFTRAANARQHEPRGSGLGMTIVKRASENIGADVIINSEEGRGTTATLVVPLET